MKNLCVFLFLLVITCHAFSQQAIPSNSFTISAGPSFPLASFNKKELSNRESGFATIGEQIQFKYDRQYWKSSGLSGMLVLTRNAVNTDQLQKGAEKLDPKYRSWVFDQKAWYTASLLVGYYRKFPISANGGSGIVSRIEAGAMWVHLPGMHGESRTDTASALLESDKANAAGFSYSVNLAFEQRIREQLYLVIDLGYFASANIRFKDVDTRYYKTWLENNLPQAMETRVRADGRQMVQFLHAGVGVQWKWK